MEIVLKDHSFSSDHLSELLTPKSKVKSLTIWNDIAQSFHFDSDFFTNFPNLTNLMLFGNVHLENGDLNPWYDLETLHIASTDNFHPNFSHLESFISVRNVNFKHLTVIGAGIQTISASFFDYLPNLVTINFRKNHLKEFHDNFITFISQNKKITSIDLSHNEIEIMPKELFTNHSITNIEIDNNPIRTLPRTLLSKLTKLKLTGYDDDFGLSISSPHLPGYMRISGYIDSPKNIKAIIRYFKHQDELEAMDPELRREIESLEEIDIDE